MTLCYCHKSNAPPGEPSGFVKGNYYDICKVAPGQWAVSGTWQNNLKQTHKHTRILDAEPIRQHLRPLGESAKRLQTTTNDYKQKSGEPHAQDDKRLQTDTNVYKRIDPQ